MRQSVLVFLLALTVTGCVEPVAKLDTRFVGPDLVQPQRVLVFPAFAPEVPDIDPAFRKEMKRRLSLCGVDSEYIIETPDTAERQRIKAKTDEFKPDAMIFITQASREFLAFTDNVVVQYGIGWSMESMDGFRPIWRGDGLFFRNRVMDSPENVGRKWANDFVDEMIAKTILTRCRVSAG